MTPRNRENVSIWLVDWSLVTIPPRDPNDDDDEEEDDDVDEEDDEPVVREPDEE
jgi:hypothetical protein